MQLNTTSTNKFDNNKPEELIFENTMENLTDISIVNKLRQSLKNGDTVRGYCIKCQEDGTLEIEFSNNIKGYIQRDNVSYKIEKDGKVHIDKARNRVGLMIECKVKEIADVEGELRITLSRKAVVEKIRDKYISELKIGNVVKGVIIRMENYGAFVDIGGDVVGLLGIGNIARVFIDKPEDVLEIGQMVEVIVSKWNVHDDKCFDIEFNRKDLLPSWSEIDQYYKEGETVVGKVKSSIDTGIFIQLNESFEGLADFVTFRKLQKGEKVRVKILFINPEREKIKLKIM